MPRRTGTEVSVPPSSEQAMEKATSAVALNRKALRSIDLGKFMDSPLGCKICAQTGGCEALHWGGWTRTTNFPVNSRTVCQLTYTPRNAINLKPIAHFP